MRRWIETIFYDAAAHVDFLNYHKEIEAELKKRIYNHLIKGENDKAALIAFELKAFEELFETFNKQADEHRKQTEKETNNGRFNY